MKEGRKEGMKEGRKEGKNEIRGNSDWQQEGRMSFVSTVSKRFGTIARAHLERDEAKFQFGGCSFLTAGGT